MKNLFLEKNIVQKLIIALVIVILFNFASPTVCSAESWLESAGGNLLKPIFDLVIWIFDTILYIAQSNLISGIRVVQDARVPEEDKDWMDVVIDVSDGIGMISLTTLSAVGAYYTAGVPVVGKVLGGATALSAVATVSCISSIVNSYRGTFDYPTIVYTPFAIFSGQVPMLDINFFNPKSAETKVYHLSEFTGTKSAEELNGLIESISGYSDTLDSQGEFNIYFDEEGELQYNGYDGDDKATKIGLSMKEITEVTTKLMLYNSESWSGASSSATAAAETKSDYENILNIIDEWRNDGYIVDEMYLHGNEMHALSSIWDFYYQDSAYQQQLAEGTGSFLPQIRGLYEQQISDTFDNKGPLVDSMVIRGFYDIITGLDFEFLGAEVDVGTEIFEGLKDVVLSDGMENIATFLSNSTALLGAVWTFGDVVDSCVKELEQELADAGNMAEYIEETADWICDMDRYDGYGILEGLGIDNGKSLPMVMWAWYFMGSNHTPEEIWKEIKDNLWSYDFDDDDLEYIAENYDYYEEQINEAYNEILELDEKYSERYIVNGTPEERAASGAFEEKVTATNVLQSTIASWYYNLRNLALVCLLVIIVYIGIRIVLSSTAPEKAKYKQMIMNWVIAICILFLLHIIMIATLTVTELIIKGLSDNCTEVVVVNLPQKTEVKNSNGTYEAVATGDENPYLYTNFVGFIRYQASIYTSFSNAKMIGYGYAIMYVMLVVQTLMFTWVYLKRVVYMAFLTIIAPLVAITYPIDKIGDGKAQAFDMWLKEYIFNALLQPIHLLIYTVLCGTAMELVVTSPIYGIVCLAFVVPAEKFIRKMFGFEKAQTPSALGGAAGAALAMSGIQRLGGMIRPDGKDDREADKQPKSHRIRTANNNEQNTMSNNATSGRNKAEGTNIIRTAPAGGEPTPTPPADGDSTPTPPTDGDSTPTPPTDGEPTPIPPTDGEPTPTPPAGGEPTPTPPADGDSTPTPSTGENPTPTPPTATSSGKDPKRFTSRTGRAIGAMWDMQKMRYAEANTPKKRARRRRKIRRAMLGGIAGAGFGLSMAAAKLAMGANASDVITSTTAGATAGYAIGSKGAQKIQELEKMDDVRESLKDGWYTSEERIKMHDEEARKKAKQDPETQALLREAFQDSKERKKFQNEWMEYCWDYGLNDIEAQIASYKDMNSAEFQQKYSGNGITEEEQKAIAVQTGLDIQRYGDVRNDYKKRDEMEKMKKYRAQNDPELQSRAQQMVEIDKANQKAEAASIEQDRNNLKNTMDADNELANLRAQERDAIAEAERKEEEVRKIMEENEALVAKDAQEVAKLEAELQKAENDMQYYENGGAVTDIEKEIKSQQQIIGDENASSENKLKAERRMQQLIYDKDNVKKKADEMRVELQDRKSKLERELRDLRSRQTQRISDVQKATMEQEVTEKREIAERAKSVTATLEKTRYGAQLESLKNREEANNVAVKSYDARLEEMATAVAKETMRQYEEAMAHHDAINGNK